VSWTFDLVGRVTETPQGGGAYPTEKAAAVASLHYLRGRLEAIRQEEKRLADRKAALLERILILRRAHPGV
jgi:hypothetical protein